jgi:Iron-containing redox enzyme
MFIAAHEWSQPPVQGGRPESVTSTGELTAALAAQDGKLAAFYARLLHRPGDALRARAADFLRTQMALLDDAECDLPDSAQDLEAWMRNGTQRALAKYSAYLAGRKNGAGRSYFSNRAHALYFLRSMAPTKLVDGAWLYGLIDHAGNPRFADLVRTYVEELGEGIASKNHVLLYRQLLARYGLDPLNDLDDSFYTQGTVQLSLACNAEEFLPEIIGFNLGYEQLPLHLLITAYELDELNIDPYYFTLHVTVDNSDTGHAWRAVSAVMDNLPRLGDADEFWQRVRGGYRLGNAGLGSCQIISGFDIEQEVIRILLHKRVAGHGVHSDYCRVAGRSVNDWLRDPASIPGFLKALQNSGWIKPGQPAEQSRFWGLLQGDRAEMFGVFSGYELQVIHDWIRGEASQDGQTYLTASAPGSDFPRHSSYRVAARRAAIQGAAPPVDPASGNVLDSELLALNQQLAQLDASGQAQLLAEAMSPSQHWTAAGLHATRLFCERQR